MSRKRRRRSPYSISIENAKNSGMEKWLYDFPGPGLVLFSSGLKSGGLLIWFERRRARVDLLFQSRRTKYGESSFESRLIDHGRTTAWSSLSLSLCGTVVETDGHMLAALVRRVTFNQVTLATLPPLRSLIESTRLKRRYREEFVSLPPSSTIEPTTIFFRNSFRESRRIYESVFFFFRVAYSIGVEDLFSNRFVLPLPSFPKNRNDENVCELCVQPVISSPRAPVLIRVIRRNEKSILRWKTSKQVARTKTKFLSHSRLSFERRVYIIFRLYKRSRVRIEYKNYRGGIGG